ncbi:hypothetical protein BGZ72_003474 [Mortierella alpina]|nr:hypothetical protein BGZ72_003474 [Mortierella alpina]
MNLSQILNPPGPSSSPLPDPSSHSHRQGRTSSPPSPTAGTTAPQPPSSTPSLASATNVIRFGSTANGTSGSPSKKHPSSVSVARLEEETMATSTGGNYTNKMNIASSIGGSHQKIKPNETNAVYSTHTFRANGPIQPAKEKTLPVPITTATATLAFTQHAAAAKATATAAAAAAAGGSGAGGAGSRGGAGNQLVMRSNTMQPMPSSTSAAKKKPRTQGSSAAESSTFQDSFQSSPSTEPRTTTAKKKPVKKASDTEIQQHPLEIRFVMTEKDGQGRLKNRKQPLSPPPQTPSPSQDSPGDTVPDQEAQESSPTPDFERNADGKFRCSWPRCGKEFTVASRLTTHFRIHSGKPPYLCGYKDCQKAFHTPD